MGKVFTRQKYVNQAYAYKIEVGYCAMPTLLTGTSPIAYTTGGYGWNADIYCINDSTAIITGYRPFGNIHPDYEMVEKYENEAKEVWKNYYDKSLMTWEECRAAIRQLLVDFCDEAVAIYISNRKRK